MSGNPNHMLLSPLLHMVSEVGGFFFMRMFPLSSDQLIPLEVIPAVTGRNTTTEEERDLRSLPIRHEGMGNTHPTPDLFRAVIPILKDLCPFSRSSFDQQQMLSPDPAHKHANN